VTRVLVIDDEPSILRALRINLTARNYEVTTASDGASGLAAVARDRPDVLILDMGLPDMDGTDVIHGVRGWSSTPIIVLSVWGAESQKVAALDAGADDYVTKPFGMDELLARLRAAVRRATPAPDEPVVTTPDFTVDLAAKRVIREDGDIRLTPTEWQLLEVLVRASGRLVTQRQLLQEVWGPQYESESNYLRVYIAQLRRKLEPEPSRPRHLLTEPGMGYRFQALPPRGDPLEPPARRPPRTNRAATGYRVLCPRPRLKGTNRPGPEREPAELAWSAPYISGT
jgi:two-component system, OmpR family, KDP operon response regulator KdpE